MIKKMSDVSGAQDWMDNHELRITSLEEWREKHEEYTKEKIKSTAETELLVKLLRESIKKQDEHLDRQDIKLDKMVASQNKIIVSVLVTIAMALAKLIIDLTILKHG